MRWVGSLSSALGLGAWWGTGNDEFYKKCGYVEYGEIARSVEDRSGSEYRDRVLMTLSLRG